MKYFHDASRFPFTQTLKEYYPQIKEEFDRWPKWFKRSMHQKYLIDQGSWKIIPLMNREKPISIINWFFPVTASLIKKLPVYENLTFSTFGPNTRLTPHNGHTDGIVRVHLGIHTNTQARLYVGEESCSITDGEVLVFEDGAEHYAENLADYDRTVLLFDMKKSDLKDYL